MLVAGQEADLRGELLSAIAEAVLLLRAHNEDRWATWLEADAEPIAADDAYGLEHLLRAFGGMGSLNDVVLPGDRLWHLRDRRWAAAWQLQRQQG